MSFMTNILLKSLLTRAYNSTKQDNSYLYEFEIIKIK